MKTPVPTTTQTPMPRVAHGAMRPDTARAINAVRSIVRAFNYNTRAVEKALGISAPQLYVLQLLHDRPSLSLREIADRLGSHQSSASIVLRRLTDAGLVDRRRPEQDRRKVEFELTPEGAATLRRAPKTVRGDLVVGSDALSDRERATLAQLLERWIDASGIDNTHPPLFGED